MIRNIEISNFRCFSTQSISDAKRLNIITGDNGAGKTSLLEAIFLPLSVGSEVALRMRQLRGLDGLFAAPRGRIEESLWGDFFHNFDMTRRITLALSGDGSAARRLDISRGRAGVTVPMDLDGPNPPVISAPVTFTWTNADGESFQATPVFKQGEISFPDTGEDMPDFFFIPALAVTGSAENAGRFSDLSKVNRQDSIVKTFIREFPQLEGLSLEVSAGSPAIFATIKGMDKKVPLPSVSSGINRMLAIMLTIASRPRSIVLVDEIENGIHWKHFPFLWRAIVSLLRENDSQLFAVTHSGECLRAAAQATGKKTDDVELWQMERIDGEHHLTRFSGGRMKSAIESGIDVR